MLAGVNGSDALYDIGCHIILEQVAEHPFFEGLSEDILGFVHGEDDHAGGEVLSGDASGDLDGIHVRHLHVQEDDIWG